MRRALLAAAAAALSVAVLSSVLADPSGAHESDTHNNHSHLLERKTTAQPTPVLLANNVDLTTGNVDFSKSSCSQHSTSFTTDGSSTDRFGFGFLVIAHATSASWRSSLEVALYADGTGSGAGSPGAKIADLVLDKHTRTRARFVEADGEQIVLSGDTTYHVVLPDVNNSNHVFSAITTNNQETGKWAIGDVGKRTWGCPSSGKTWSNWTVSGSNYKLRFAIWQERGWPLNVKAREEPRKLTFTWEADDDAATTNWQIQLKHKWQSWGDSGTVATTVPKATKSWSISSANASTLGLHGGAPWNEHFYDFRIRSDKTGSDWLTYRARPSKRSSAVNNLAQDALSGESATVALSWAPPYRWDNGLNGTGPNGQAVSHYMEVRWKPKDAADSAYTTRTMPVVGRHDEGIAPGPANVYVGLRRAADTGPFFAADLTVGAEYTFQMRTDRGDGSWATIDVVVPNDPRPLATATAGDKRAVVQWVTPMAVTTSMEYRYKKRSQAWTALTAVADVPAPAEGAPAGSAVITGLDNGVTYDLLIRSDLAHPASSASDPFYVDDADTTPTSAELAKGWTMLTVTPAAETEASLSKPANLKAAQEKDGIKLTWDAVNDANPYIYAVRYALSSEDYAKDDRLYNRWYFLTPAAGHTYQGTEATVPLTFFDVLYNRHLSSPRLTTGRTYKFQVAVVNGSYQVGPPSDEITAIAITELAAPTDWEIQPINRGFHVEGTADPYAARYQQRRTTADAQGECTFSDSDKWENTPTLRRWKQVTGYRRFYFLGNWLRIPIYSYHAGFQAIPQTYDPAIDSRSFDLTNGQGYCFQFRAATGTLVSDAGTARVKGTGVGGTGPHAAAQYAVVPRSVQEAPGGLSAAAGNGQATVCWNQPADDDLNTPGIQTGGAGKYAIRGWQYSIDNGAWQWLSSVSPPAGSTATRACSTVRGLTNGQWYRIRVRATGKSGDNYPDAQYPFLERTGQDRLLAGNATPQVGVTPRGPVTADPAGLARIAPSDPAVLELGWVGGGLASVAATPATAAASASPWAAQRAQTAHPASPAQQTQRAQSAQRAQTAQSLTSEVSLRVSPNPVTEGSPVAVTASLSRALTRDVTVPLTVTRVTSEATDHGTLPSVVVAAGQTTGMGSISVALDDDADDETFTVAIDTAALPSSLSAGSQTSHTVTVSDIRVAAGLAALPVWPNAPTRLQAIAGDGQVMLTWDEVVGATSYEYQQDSGHWTAADVGAAYTVLGLDNGTVYSFKVRAVGLDSRGAATAAVRATPRAPQQAQAVAASLSVSPNPVAEGSPVTVTATLSAPLDADVAVPVTVTRLASEAGDHGTLRSVPVAAGQTAGTAQIETHVDADGDDETFSVALDAARLPSSLTAGSPATETVTVTDIAATPDAPTGLNAEAGDTSVTLSWDALAGATGYEYRQGSGPWTSVGSATSWTVTGLVNGTEYSFAVRALNLTLIGPATDSVTALPQAPLAGPDPVGQVGVTHWGTTLDVQWWWGGARATAYDVEYRASGAVAWTRAVTGHTGTSVTVTVPDPSTSYTVRVRATNAEGGSDWTVSPLAVVSAPDPVSLVTVVHNGDSLSVSWGASARASRYDVEYRPEVAETWTQAVTGHTGTSLTVTGTDPATAYVVRVRAANAGGGSDWTVSASASLPEWRRPAPQPVASVTVVHNGGSLSVSWPLAQWAATYWVEHSSDGGQTWQPAVVQATEALSLTVHSADRTKAYMVRVKAYNEHGESAWTTSAATAPAAPDPVGSVRVRPFGSRLIVMYGSARATSYDVEYSGDDGATWTAFLTDTPRSFIHISGLDGTKTYIVRVKAKNSSGESDWVYSAPPQLQQDQQPNQQPGQDPGKQSLP